MGEGLLDAPPSAVLAGVAQSLPQKTGYGRTKKNTITKQPYATGQEMIDDLKGWRVRYDFHRRLRRKTP